MEIFKGDHHKNMKNVIMAVLAPLPCIIFYISFLRHYEDPNHCLSPVWSWCYNHPLLLANTAFFLNITVLFWLLGHFQSSRWMIDPYWTGIPMMLVYYYATHPLANYNPWRSKLVIFVTSIWALRLCHNYFRRENWQFGAREDWRFIDMRHHYGRHWWWVSFFAIYLAQQVFLTGLSVPLYVIHTVEAQLSIWDFVAITVSLSGVVIAYNADTQLHKYVTKNVELNASGKPIVPVLDTGLWRFSRHPNYVGEQLFWWGFWIISWSLGHGWTFFGTLVNSLCLAYVTVLVENRMLKQSFRAEAYRQYQKTTAVWIPWFKKSEPKNKMN